MLEKQLLKKVVILKVEVVILNLKVKEGLEAEMLVVTIYILDFHLEKHLLFPEELVVVIALKVVDHKNHIHLMKREI